MHACILYCIYCGGLIRSMLCRQDFNSGLLTQEMEHAHMTNVKELSIYLGGVVLRS